jgi:hypothetical protein
MTATGQRGTGVLAYVAEALSPETGRDTLLFFGPDGKLMSAKWHNVKAVLRQRRRTISQAGGTVITLDRLSSPADAFTSSVAGETPAPDMGRS